MKLKKKITFNSFMGIILMFLMILISPISGRISIEAAVPGMIRTSLEAMDFSDAHIDDSLGLGGAEIWMLDGNLDRGQQLSIIVVTKNGRLIVFDGGLKGSSKEVCAFISQHGGKVDHWFITHPHHDHLGVLVDVLKRRSNPLISDDDYSNIEIENIYYSFAPIEFYEKYEQPSRLPVIYEAMDVFSKEKRSNIIKDRPAGTVIEDDGVKVEILNNAMLSKIDAGNNSTITYMLEVNGKKMLILGDLPYEAANKLLEELPAEKLKADIVQMAHHGQHGACKEFYERVAPSICLWPTDEVLYQKGFEEIDPKSDVYTVAVTKKWIEDMGITKNYWMRDGDYQLR